MVSWPGPVAQADLDNIENLDPDLDFQDPGQAFQDYQGRPGSPALSSTRETENKGGSKIKIIKIFKIIEICLENHARLTKTRFWANLSGCRLTLVTLYQGHLRPPRGLSGRGTAPGKGLVRIIVEFLSRRCSCALSWSTWHRSSTELGNQRRASRSEVSSCHDMLSCHPKASEVPFLGARPFEQNEKSWKIVYASMSTSTPQ